MYMYMLLYVRESWHEYVLSTCMCWVSHLTGGRPLSL